MTSATLARVVPYARRAAGFVSRHRWSVPLSLASTGLFLLAMIPITWIMGESILTSAGVL